MLRLTPHLTILATLFATACTAMVENGGEEQGGDIKGDGTTEADVSTFYRFSANRLGGWFLTGENQDMTRCADGALKDRCDVIAIDWAEIKYPEAEIKDLEKGQRNIPLQFLLKGTITKKTDVLTLSATELWIPVGMSTAPQKGLAMLAAEKEPCQAPCMQFSQTALNKADKTALDAVDLAGLEMPPESTTAWLKDVAEKKMTMIVAGAATTTADKGTTLAVKQAWIKFVPTP